MINNNVIPALERSDVYIDESRIEKGLTLQKYFEYELLPWELFQFSLIAGLFLKRPGLPDDIYFHEIWNMLGRGSGKNGFIDFLALYFLSPFHGVSGYNIDLIANGEEQAKTSITDVSELIKNPRKPEYKSRLSRHFKALAETVTGLDTGSVFRLNTTSVKNKDSKRTGCIIFDEKHQYNDKDLQNMSTLMSGLGKMKWWRIITITTDGHNREGVLDKEKLENIQILQRFNPKNRKLVFWCRIEDKNEWNDINKLVKANPSLPYPSFASMRDRIELEIDDMPNKPFYYAEFMAKRCNFPLSDPTTCVASWEDITACMKEPTWEVRPGDSCIGGIDYANTNDFIGCGLIFRRGKDVAIKHHTFICKQGAAFETITGKGVPLYEWQDKGYCTIVDAPQILPETVADWFAEQQKTYNILWICIDSYRYAILNRALSDIGFDFNAGKNKNVWLTRTSDVIKVTPVVISAFVGHHFCGIDPMMRWAINNTKASAGKDGNTRLEKIEPFARKTDSFMWLIHAMCKVDEIPDVAEMPDIAFTTFTY